MNKLRFIFLSMLSLTFVFLLCVPVVFAQSNFREGEVVTLDEDEVVDENFFAGGEAVRILGTVNGDVYAAGGNVVIDGVVNGDVLAAGGTLTISGVVSGNVRAAGGQINISGEIGRNVTAVGGQITINEDAQISGSFTSAGGTLEVKAPLGGGVQAAGGNFFIDDQIDGNITYAGGNLQLGSNANVSGDVTYFSEQEAVIAEDATITGELTQKLPPQEAKEARAASQKLVPAALNFWMIISFVSAFIVGLLVTKLAPNFSVRVAENIKSRFLANLGLGFVFLVVTPVAAIVLFMTVIGIPLGFLLLVVYGITLYVVKIFAALFIGNFISAKISKSKSIYLDLFLGLLVFSVLWLVPVVGWVAQFVLVLASIGAVLTVKKELFNSLTDKKLL